MKKYWTVFLLLVPCATTASAAEGGDGWTLRGAAGEYRITVKDGELHVELDGRRLAEGERWRREGADVVFSDDQGVEFGRLRRPAPFDLSLRGRLPARVRLGVGLAPLEAPLAAQLPEDIEGGVLLTTVLPGGPAELGGLMPNDILVEFDGAGGLSPERLREMLATHDPGDTVELEYVRAGRLRSAEVELGAAVPDVRGSGRWPWNDRKFGVGRDGRWYSWPSPNGDAPRLPGRLRADAEPFGDALQQWKQSFPGLRASAPAGLETRLEAIETKLERIEALLEELARAR